MGEEFSFISFTVEDHPEAVISGLTWTVEQPKVPIYTYGNVDLIAGKTFVKGTLTGHSLPLKEPFNIIGRFSYGEQIGEQRVMNVMILSSLPCKTIDKNNIFANYIFEASHLDTVNYIKADITSASQKSEPKPTRLELLIL